MRTPFSEALAAGDTCNTCHAPGLAHKGHVICDTPACPARGTVIRDLRTDEPAGPLERAARRSRDRAGVASPAGLGGPRPALTQGVRS